ncbi:MAG: cytochrome c [Terracidiphilus sp.]
MLKSFLLFAAVVLLVLASASAPARPPQESQTPAAKKATPDAMAKAKKVYQLDCAMCHGSNGDGKTDLAKDMQLTLLDWSDPKALAGKSDQQLFEAIRKGSGKMPPEDDARAKNDEVHDLVIYIRKFAKDQPAGTAPATDQPAATPAPAAPPATAPSN